MATSERRPLRLSPSFDERWQLLGRPWFLGLVFVLAINDHLLKDLYPGWWTGKLSDIAGVAIVGTVTSIFAGRGKGLVLTGIGFLILKTFPGAAEIARPFLGGVTSRDASDLVALSILIPLARLLGPRVGLGSRVTASPLSPNGQHKIWDRCRAILSISMPVAGAVLAVVFSTATSCGPDSASRAWLRMVGSSTRSSIKAGVTRNGLLAATVDALGSRAMRQPDTRRRAHDPIRSKIPALQGQRKYVRPMGPAGGFAINA
jgi:hypothetical protein